MRIVLAFIKKEFLQIIKDPSSLIIAFILPLILLYIYTYGINMDDVNIRLGIKNDDANTEEPAEVTYPLTEEPVFGALIIAKNLSESRK